MAAPFSIIRRTSCRVNANLKTFNLNCDSFNGNLNKFNFQKQFNRLSSTGNWNVFGLSSYSVKSSFRVAAIAICGGYAAKKVFQDWSALTVYAKENEPKRPDHTPSRKVRSELDTTGLKLTLYQYQTCPFCCKARAALDYYGFSYDVIEVNSVSKKQLKWSDYKKVPILIVEQQGKDEVALHDSSVIISILESFLHDRSTPVGTFKTYFPPMEEKIAGRTKLDFPNKYFVMFQEKSDLGTTAEQRHEERKWRKWTDQHLVHMLSPNAYRTPSEALQAFNYFSQVGEWEKNFGVLERLTVIYVGAFVMYVLGKWLKRKYELKSDVRESLYEALNDWVKAVGKGRPFMGGSQPNLADLSVYGVLSSIEGCDAWADALAHSKIRPWFQRMKKAVTSSQGAAPWNAKTVPSKVHQPDKDIENSQLKA